LNENEDVIGTYAKGLDLLDWYIWACERPTKETLRSIIQAIRKQVFTKAYPELSAELERMISSGKDTSGDAD
jgi:hypothetical protein